MKEIDLKLFAKLPKIKDFSSRKEWEDSAWRYCLDAFSKIGSGSHLHDLLRLFMGPREQKNILQRIIITLRIIEGKSYQEINRELWTSPQTISAVKKSLKDNEHKNARKTRMKRRASPSPYKVNLRRRTQRIGRFRKTKYGRVRLP